MNRTELKQLLLQGLIALVVLTISLILLFMFPPLILSIWASGVIIFAVMKRKNPEHLETKKYQTLQKLFYFQMINLSFGFFFILPLGIVALTISIITLFWMFKKERRENPKFIKWAKYIGFYFFTFVVLNILHTIFPNIGSEEGLLVFAVITFINGATAAIYLRVEPKIHPARRLIALLIVVAMIGMTTITMFPQYDGSRILNIFGG